MNNFYYLASPYAHKDEKIMYNRKVIVCNVVIKLLKNKIYAISPIAHNTNLVDECTYKLNTGWNFWKLYDFAMLKSCTALLVLKIDGWEESIGVTAEIAYAKELGMPIEYVTEGGVICQ